MSKHVDIKVTMWRRLHFTNDADMNKIIEIIKNSHSTNDICDDTFGFLECETLYETEEELLVKDNGGCSTIEVFDEDVNEIDPLWTNAVEENDSK